MSEILITAPISIDIEKFVEEMSLHETNLLLAEIKKTMPDGFFFVLIQGYMDKKTRRAYREDAVRKWLQEQEAQNRIKETKENKKEGSK